MKSLRIVLLLLCCGTFAFGRDRDFRGVVNAIEHTYGVHHLRIPLLGLAMFFARPEGISGFHLAVFEGFDRPADMDEVRRVVENSMGEGWYPFVRVRSRDDVETTLIYANPSGGKMRLGDLIQHIPTAINGGRAQVGAAQVDTDGVFGHETAA